jgi:hypothetical protein
LERKMNVRPFDWRDLPALHRYRQQATILDSALVLTRGPQLISGALLSYLAPAMGVFTIVSNGGEDSRPPLIGQMMHTVGTGFAHLTFLTPDQALESPALPRLLEYLMVLGGERGAFRLLADVDEHSLAFEVLRRSSFAIYSRQRIWQLTGQIGDAERPTAWRSATSRDAVGIRSLYNNLVPGLVQQVEPFSSQRPRGLVYQEGEDLLGYVELKYGHRGIWAQPFVHPDAEDVVERLVDLVHHLPYRRSRPVYICVRSYQSWLESAIEELGAEAGPRQAVMVKHLAIPQKAVRAFALPALEGGHPEISAPFARLAPFEGMALIERTAPLARTATRSKSKRLSVH